jgi:hypothetical protein
MRSKILACAFLLGAVSASPAFANMCRADTGRTCATGMPVDGYCMCGNAEGTVVSGVQKKAQRPAPAQSRMSQTGS